MVTVIVSFLLGVVTGALVARNNIKKLNKIVAEAEEAAAAIDSKIEGLPDKYKKILGKD